MLDKVNFTTIEDGTDLVLSFSFDEGTEFGIDGFIMERAPKFEYALQPHERGVSIDWTDDDVRILVTKIELSKNTIKIHSQEKNYEFDISRLDEDDMDEIKNILKKMNFDNCFQLDTSI